MAGFTPVEEVERISMGPRDMVGRVVRDFCREGWVGDQSISTSMVGLAEEVELGEEKRRRRRWRILWGRQRIF